MFVQFYIVIILIHLNWIVYVSPLSLSSEFSLPSPEELRSFLFLKSWWYLHLGVFVIYYWLEMFTSDFFLHSVVFSRDANVSENFLAFFHYFFGSVISEDIFVYVNFFCTTWDLLLKGFCLYWFVLAWRFTKCRVTLETEGFRWKHCSSE